MMKERGREEKKKERDTNGVVSAINKMALDEISRFIPHAEWDSDLVERE